MVCVGKQSAWLRISGRANFHSSLDFKTLFNELQRRGFTRFVVDLTECSLMDSTFLGVLTGFGLAASETNGRADAQRIELLNPNPRISELLENLGVLHLFSICRGPAASPGEIESPDLSSREPTQEELTRTCLEAHQTLMDVNPENAARFKEVARFLSEDLKKLQSRH